MINLKKNYASLKSSAGNLYELSDDDISKMHEVLLEMYDDLFSYCEKHSLKLIAGGGTALGAVRHKGFIPWDDDMDLTMTREDYQLFIKNFSPEMEEKYDLLAPGNRNGSNCFLMRISKKNTTLLNMIDEASPYPSGIYIDITPIDYVPNNRVKQKVKGELADILRYISYSVYWKQYLSQSLRDFMINSAGKNYYRFRIFIGTVFSFFSAEQWFRRFDRFIQGKESNYLTVAAGRKRYCGEIFHKTVYFPVHKTEFDGRYIYIYITM